MDVTLGLGHGSKLGWLMLVVVSLVSACSSESSSQSRTTTPTPVDTEQPPPRCIEGKACACPPGQAGLTECSGTTSHCACQACDPLQVVDAPTVKGCAGDTIGTWRLTELTLGRLQISLSVAGNQGESCSYKATAVNSAPPRSLMSLEDGGRSHYYTEPAPLKVAWSDSCVTQTSSLFACGSPAWKGVSNCKLDCDTCTCDSNSKSIDDDSLHWQRTADKLYVSPFGDSIAFDYCVQGDKLELSGLGMYLVYERLHTLSKPTPCAERKADKCETGDEATCRLGACAGSPDCAEENSEGTCLTKSGCSWDAKQCAGTDPDECRLQDFGVVPGCEITAREMTCTGTPAPCESGEPDACADGCKLNQSGRCNGPDLDCDFFYACPSGYCRYDGTCSGVTSCSAMVSESVCTFVNDNYDSTPDDDVEGESPCSWEARFCEGTPTPCEQYSPSICEDFTGCKLTPVP